MKIFNKTIITKKEYKEKSEELEKALYRYDDMLKDVMSINSEYERIANKLFNIIDKREEVILNLKSNLRKLQGSRGGLIAENNKLKKLVEELTRKLEDSFTNKYLVKKIPSGKMPKKESIKIKSHTVQSKITKQMYKED